MSVKFCGSCGSPLQENVAFCQNCGWKVIDPNSPQQPATVQQAPVQQQQVYQQPPQPAYQQPPMPNYTQQQPVKKKSGCGGCLIAVVIALILAGIALYFGGGMIRTQLEKMGVDTSDSIFSKLDNTGFKLPSIGGSKFKAEDISGPYTNEFETTNVTVDGETSPDYYAAIGQKMTMGGRIEMSDDKNGTITFLDGSFGSNSSSNIPLTVNGDSIEVDYEDRETNTKLIYKGALSMENDKLKIEGTYETTYLDPYSNGTMVMSGNWIAYSAKGTVSKDLNVSQAKKDVTLDDIQGTWSGIFSYAKIENLDQMPDVSEEEKDMMRSFIGQTLNARMLFEGDNLMITLQDPTGGESDLEDMPPINLDKGVFTTSLVMNESDGVGNMNLSGYVFEGDGGLKINAEMTMEMAFVNNNTIKMIITFDVTKD